MQTPSHLHPFIDVWEEKSGQVQLWLRSQTCVHVAAALLTLSQADANVTPHPPQYYRILAARDQTLSQPSYTYLKVSKSPQLSSEEQSSELPTTTATRLRHHVADLERIPMTTRSACHWAPLGAGVWDAARC